MRSKRRFEHSVTQRIKVPENYSLVKSGPTMRALNNDYKKYLQNERLDEIVACQESSRRGEGTILSVSGMNKEIVLRHYSRGGALSFIMKHHYLSWRRPFNELNITDFALKNNLNAPVVIFASSTKSLGLYKNDLATLYVEGAKDLMNYFEHVHNTGDHKKKREIIKLTSREITKMHGLGIFHDDLHLKNILVKEDEDKLKIYLVDFDKAKVLKDITHRLRMKNLLRLRRSIIKFSYTRNSRDNLFSRTDYLRFAKVYFDDNRSEIRKANRTLRRSFWRQNLHKIFWKRERK